ncbi:MAG: tetratricopeptide repeat protein [Solirubrobacterales bacterium]
MNFEPESIIKEMDYQYGKMNMSAMENYLVSTIQMAADRYGEDSIGFAALLNELGAYYRAVSKYEKAEEIFLKAKNIIQKAAGEYNANYATTINNLAGVYRLNGEYKKAENLFLEAIKIYNYIGLYGSFPHSSALNNLGLLYMEMKEYEQAVKLFKESNEMVKKDNKNLVVYATGLVNLANAYIKTGKNKEAEKLLIEAIEVYRSNNLQGNSHYGSAIDSLGLFYFSIREFEKAENLFHQVLNLRENEYGSENHESAKASDNLSLLYENTGKFELAEKFAMKSSAIYYEIFGDAHPAYKKSIEVVKRIQSKLKQQNSSDSNISKSIKEISGMELSFICFAQFSAATICRKFKEYSTRVAAGLVGEGSECYGFDDEYSRDHDFGPSFCIWFTENDFIKFGRELQIEYIKLSKDFYGLEMKNENQYSAERRGVFEIGDFYSKYIGLKRPPVTLQEWRAIPEENLSIVTNGRVFIDSLGDFSRFRNELKAFYPEDVRLKKLAARCAIMSQGGQYNYPRSIKRLEYVAAQQALASFISAAISAVFLLNKEYKPYYKWMHRATKTLPILGEELYYKLLELASENNCNDKSIFSKRVQLIEEICQMVSKEIVNQQMSRSSSDFLLHHANEIQSNIVDTDLRSMHIMTE